MTEFSPVKKLILSISCAFLFLIYAPLACLVGNDTAEDIECCAQAENPTCEHLIEETSVCENCREVL